MKTWTFSGQVPSDSHDGSNSTKDLPNLVEGNTCSCSSTTPAADDTRLSTISPWKAKLLRQHLSPASASRTSLLKHRESSNYQKSQVFWPEDLLPKDFPDARVLTFGYDSNVSQWFRGPANKNTLSEHAHDLLSAISGCRPLHRPIIFIAHSLGGILVKEVRSRPTLRTALRLIDFASVI